MKYNDLNFYNHKPNRAVQLFARRHPILIYGTTFICLPICIILAVSLLAVLLTLPVAFFGGWF